MLEGGAHRHGARELAGELRGHLRHQQRVAAEGEEVIVDRQARQGQGLLIGAGHLLLGGRARQHLRAFIGDGRARRGGQRLAIDLAAAGERQRGHRQKARGDHVLGERARQVLAQNVVGGQAGGGAGARHRVGDQADIAGAIFAGDDDGLGDRRVAAERQLDLAQLDAIAAQLDLEVGAAEALEDAGGAVAGGLAGAEPAAEVAGAVHAGAGGGAERIGEEALLGQLGAIVIADGDAVAADEQLADHADRHRLQIFIEDVDGGVGDRRADGDARGIGDPLRRRPHRGLGRAVEVPQLADAAVQRGGEGAVEGLAAAQGAEGRGAAWGAVRAAAPAGGQQQAPGGRGGLHHGGAAALEQGAQRGAVDGLLAGDQLDLGADDQRQEQLEDGDVEGQGGDGGDAIGGRHARGARHAGEEVGDGAVRDGDALGGAGGAGGVDDVGGGVAVANRAARGGRCGGGGVERRQLIEQDVARAGQRDAGGDRGGRGDDGDAGVLHHEGEALGGKARIERDVGGAGAEDAQQRGQEVMIAIAEQADAATRLDAGGAQRGGDGGGLGGQLVIGARRLDAVGAGDPHGDALGLAAGGGGEQLLDAAGLRERALGAVPAGEGAAIFVGDDGQPADRLLGIGDGAAQQQLVGGEPAADGGGVEQIGVVLALQAHAGGAIVDGVDEQLEGLVVARVGGQLQRQAGQRVGLAAERLIDVEHHRDQRQAAGIAGDRQALQHAAEGDVLVIEGVEHALAGGGHQLGEAIGALHGGAQRQHVDAVADQALEALGVLAGGGDADDQLGGAAEAVQERVEAGEQGGQQAGAEAGAHLLDGGDQLGRQHVILAAGAGGAHRRARAIGGQIEGRHAGGEAVDPPALVGDHLGAGGAGGAVGGVGQKRGRGGQLGGAAAGGQAVEGGEVLDDDPVRPAVEDDVVAGEHQDVVIGIELDQLGADQRAALEIEGLLDVAGGEGGEGGVALGGGALGEIVERHLQLEGGVRAVRCPDEAAILGEGGAQGVVAAGQLAQRLAQRRDI